MKRSMKLAAAFAAGRLLYSAIGRAVRAADAATAAAAEAVRSADGADRARADLVGAADAARGATEYMLTEARHLSEMKDMASDAIDTLAAAHHEFHQQVMSELAAAGRTVVLDLAEGGRR